MTPRVSTVTKNNFKSRRVKQLRPDTIAALTIHLFLKEGGPEGKEHEIWHRAEKMLREEVERQSRPLRAMNAAIQRAVRPEAQVNA